MSAPLTLAERISLGRQQRKHMRRADQAGWTSRQRTETPLRLIQASVRGRVPSLIKLKNQRMAVSPFSYFRGAVPVMAHDLSLTANSGIHTQLCGDAHALNLGAYEGPDGRLLFDINDFDETIPGPFEWDVKRMTTSLILAGWDAGAKDAQCQQAAAVFLARYRSSILFFARMPVIELARYQVHRLDDVETMSQIFAVAQRSTPLHNLDTLTEPVQGAPAAKQLASRKARPNSTEQVPDKSEQPPTTPTREEQRIFKVHQPTLTRVTGTAAQKVLDSLATYAERLYPERRRFLAQYRPIDVAFKVVGTGSVGLRDYCVYMEGIGPNDPLFLQIKEETRSAYAQYLDQTAAAPYHQGQRVVEGERAMQLQSDPFLGWTTIEGRDYLVRQLNDHKAAVDLSHLKASSLMDYARVCGEILARGHARSGDPAMAAGYIGSSGRFDEVITKFAILYARQTELDWKHFVRAADVQRPTKSTARP